jgi:hypothetical protein
MAMAHADSNRAYLDQGGTTNIGTIDQSGATNAQAGRTGQYVTQNGDDNTLTILQTNDKNRIGVTGNPYGKVIQTGSHNVLDAEQTGNDNQTAIVTQTSNPGLSGPSNVATIKQQRNYGGIGTVSQTSAVSSTAVMNTMTLTQKGGNSNKIGTASQEFTGNSGDTRNAMTIMQNSQSNHVHTASQSGFDNDLDITQEVGRTNRISTASQNGSGNVANLLFSGRQNGDGGFTSGGAAEAAGAGASTSVQNGTDNLIGVTVNASYNQFGFYQNGQYNQATGISITDDSNELGVWQDGTSNTLSLAAITGTKNNLGVRQDGATNFVSLTVTGDQNGGYNGFGSNVAGTLAVNLGMTAGLIDQNGTKNHATLNISGNGNVFATLQDNSGGGLLGNTINGTQNNTGITGNQVAVAQVGDNNHGNFSQVGSGNVATVTQ